MKESPLMIKSKVFALDVIKVCKELIMAKCEAALYQSVFAFNTAKEDTK